MSAKSNLRIKSLCLIALSSIALSVSACTSNPVAPPAKSPTTTKTPGSGSETLSSAPEELTPLTLDCSQILTNDQIYNFNPNFASNPDAQVTADSNDQKILDWAGTSCSWINESSQYELRISVGNLPPSQVESVKNMVATTATLVPTYGIPPEVEGYFEQTGTVHIFTGTKWIIASSPTFYEPGDAAPLMGEVLQNVNKL